MPTEARIHEIALSQHGLVNWAQLLDAGFTARMIWRRRQELRLLTRHRGVYQVGPVAAPLAREMAAILACGEHAVISHWSSATVWLPSRQPDSHAPVEVWLCRGDRRRRPGIHVRRTSRLQSSEVTVHSGLPITTPARTLLDLAALTATDGRVRALEQTAAEMLRERLTTSAELTSLIKRHARRRGVRLLRAIIEQDGGAVFTRSAAEDKVLALIRVGGIPTPRVNVRVAGYEVDFLWRDKRLILEVDGFAHHSSRSSFEADRRRDAELTAAGFRVLRVTWRQITNEPQAVLVRIARTLGQQSAR